MQFRQPSLLGFTLVEMVVVIALFALAAVIGSRSLLGTLRKNWLSSEVDKIVVSLKQAQQNSRAAIEGKQYGVQFSQVNHSYQPIPSGTIQRLQHGVKISTISDEKIEFRKLTGELILNSGNSQAEILMELGNLQTKISINSQGVVEIE